MSHGGGESVAGMDPNSIENRQAVGASQGHASLAPGHGSWSSSTGQATVSWNFHQTGSGPIENGPPSSSGYYYDQQKEMSVSADAQDGINTASHASGEANAAQAYAGYDPYGYSMYYGYQQPASDSSSQQVGASQTPGAPYQPPSSFQNTGHYVGPPSYSASYYDAGDHQMAAGYNHSIQTNNWNATNYGSYPQQHYPGYTTSDTNSAQATSTAVASSLHYQQPYNPWPYYSPSAPVVSGTLGTQNTAATATSVAAFPVQGASIGYPYPNNQPPPPGTTSWNRDSGPSGLPYSQVTKDNTPYNKTGGWEVGAQGFQNTQVQLPSYFQMPLDSNPPHENYDNQQKNVYPQGPSSQLSSTNQVFENFQPPLQNVMTMDARRVSKIQIPTNPRIASSLALGMPKPDKEGSPTNAAMKPAYISVSVPKLNNKISSHADAEAEAEAEAVAKGTFPPSLRAYVERTFARCKDDAQRVANQNIMKEMITNASADGTLLTKNWDVEPLFPLPNTSADMADQSNVQSSLTTSSLPKFKRSPNRRTKSRWEPIAEVNVVEKLASANNDSPKDVSWGHLKGTERTVDSRNYESTPNGWSGVRFLSSQQRTPKIAQRPVKKLRFSNASNVTENGDASSDSDKEQSLTKYYASAIALADSPEERKRREHRYKRFEKGQDNQAEVKHARPKIAGAGNIYTRRASAMLLSKSNEDGFSRAVEDIDWDALTVRGTCHEIEKRYLRLTSAPDPATVRPEEILEKALHMVQTSQRNYLYKCDQLKSIRQDLTVQRIQNELTVKVYETHARLALEAGDLPEYNQCQSQLKRLYAEGIKGCHMEFSAYNLLCVILHSNNKRDLLSSMARLSDEAKEDEAVKHALAVRSAVSSGNYILFFRLYKAAPNLNTCLMDLCVEQMRFDAVKSMSKSYRPIVPVTYIARVLGFSRGPATEDGQDKFTDGLEECGEWLRAHGAVLTVDNNGELQLDAKLSSSSLYMPDPEDAVAHGDATLAVNDFLTRAS